MAHDLEKPSRLLFQADALHEPKDWEQAEAFPSLREALEAAVDRMADGPWIKASGKTLRPAEIEDLWKEVFRSRSD
jgi:hypothetical protein